ncbi:MAG: VOC family protein [Rhodobacteraceae bacterium]|nr:VOC family protein [Paracoccaceae bacterium]
MARLEHVNITVSDPQRAAKLMDTLFGWKIRWEGASIHGGYTIHVGDKDDYLAFYTPPKTTEETVMSYDIRGGLNHVALVVDDFGAVEARVLAEGLKTSNHGDYEPGRRFYFHDHDDIEYEIVSYA